MKRAQEITAAFQPAFCHRGDCAASPDTPFCSGCGADIAAYLDATTGAHEAVRVDPADQVTTVARKLDNARRHPLWNDGQNGTNGHGAEPLTAKPLVRLPARATAPEELAPPVSRAARVSWHDRAVIASFTGAMLVGALAAVAADLV